MKRGGISVFAVMLFMFSTVSLAAVTGRVTDTVGDPIDGALVSFIEDSDAGYFLYRDITDAQGYYEIDLSAPSANDENTPSTFSLDQNYPNPFNPATTIPFTLDTPSHITLTIYNIMGQRINTLVDDYLGAGSHSIVWYGSDDRGNHMSSGVYFYRLVAGRHTATKKMLLLDGGSGFSSGTPAVVNTKPAQILRTAQDIAEIAFTVTITHDDVVDYEETGVRQYPQQSTNFVVFRRNTAAVVEGISMVPITSASTTAVIYDIYDLGSYVSATLSSFDISAHEITQAQYEDIMGVNPSVFKLGGDYPVENVSRDDAILFCNALSERLGLQPCYTYGFHQYVCNFNANGFRLPTKAEWEYACRAGTTTSYYSGNSEDDLDRAAWYVGNSDSTTHPVGQKLPNKFGLYDMHGNVWELNNDKHPGLVIYKPTVIYNPTNDYGYTMITGGGYLSDRFLCRWYSSTDVTIYEPPSSIGFRIVRRPDGYGVTEPVESLVLQSFDLVDENPTLIPAEYFSARFQVRNPNRVAMDVRLILRYKSASGQIGEFTPLAQQVTINPKTGSYSRQYKVPDDMPSGSFALSWIITDLQGTVLDESPYLQDQLTVNPTDSSMLNELTFQEIPGGTFIMGEETGSTDHPDNPTHKVNVSSFLMSTCEITQAQFQTILNINPSKFSWGDTYPVENVSWIDAVRFCNRLSTLAGYEICYDEVTWICDHSKNGYRLPTEAEWEYACRAGTSTDYYSGNNEYLFDQVAWFGNNSDRQSHPVGQKTPNNFGLYDMHGNVGEWCNDNYDDTYYEYSPLNDPANNSSITNNVIRGGNYTLPAEYCRSAYRSHINQYDLRWGVTGYQNIGFRVVRRPDYEIPDLENRLPTFETIPGGFFQMGDDDYYFSHPVSISGFKMSKYEITQYVYEMIMDENPSVFAQGGNYPVENVSWYDAVRFCNRLSDYYSYERCYDEETWECDFTKSGFRLPTEAEWEYACRAGSTTDFFFGDNIEFLSDVCWYELNSNNQTHPVGIKLQNPFGLCDMHGNVAEWCNDWSELDYTGSENPTGPADGTIRVIRGGHWDAGQEICRSASRYQYEFEDQVAPEQGRSTVGFRVVMGTFDTISPSITISGTVTGADEVTVTLHGDMEDSQVVNDGETYSFTVIRGGSYEITAIKDGYQFAPATDELSNITADIVRDFTTIPIQVSMIELPGGSYIMGSNEALLRYEKPEHEVIVSPFALSQFEITQRQYEAVMGNNPSHYQGSDLPVEQVSWFDAVLFCNRLSEQWGYELCYDETTWECDFTKNGFRLPTEAEWEYACRAGTQTDFNTGDTEADLDNAGWYISNSSYRTHSVGQKLPNAWGLYDMHGNIQEWCNDWYGPDYYTESPSTHPIGPEFGESRVLRGGNWRNSVYDCRSWRRAAVNPSSESESWGFRVARGTFKPSLLLKGTVSGANDVTVVLSGDKSDSCILDDGESYSFIVEHSGSYTISATASGYQFTPESSSYESLTRNIVRNFTTNPVYVTMMEIPSGSFNMGTSAGENYEEPVHEITISGFEMGVYEVTQDQYEQLTGTNPSSSYGTLLPVENVDWYTAARFCNQLSEQWGYKPCYNEYTWECDFTTNGFRLPTEAEWEYACRAGTETVYNTGNTEADLAVTGWYNANSDSVSHPVGQKTPNAWGLFDMHGNVWEWCNDWYASNYYSETPSTDPVGALSGKYRILRGGCWIYDSWQCWSARRGWGFPDYNKGFVGFRVVRRP